MEIRPRTDDDLDALVVMAALVHARDGYPPRYADDLVALFTRPVPVLAWVAVADGAVVGHVALHDATTGAAMALASGITGLASDGLIVLARLLVAPTARGAGLGRALVDTAVAEAHRRGRRPYLDVAVTLGAAIGLYESMGWVRLGTVTATFRDAEPLDEHVFLGLPPL
jgi:GNAT superfamily N-acetyltransferase